MRLLTPLAAVAALAIAAPAFAQETAPAPQAPAAAPAEEAQSPEEAALEAKGEAFEARMNQMSAELDAVMQDQSKDNATAAAEASAIVDRYAPEMTAFAGEVETFLRAQSEKPENAAQKDQLLAAATAAGQAIRAVPDQVRGQVDQAIAARGAAPSAPAETPATPQ